MPVSKKPSKALTKNIIPISPELAAHVGKCGAIVLQQIEYWTTFNLHIREDGHSWVYKTYDDLAADTGGMYSASSIKQALPTLKRTGVLVVGKGMNKFGYDKTNWYRIDKKSLELLLETAPPKKQKLPNPSGKNCPIKQAEFTLPIPETTQRLHRDYIENQQPKTANTLKGIGDIENKEDRIERQEEEGRQGERENLIKEKVVDNNSMGCVDVAAIDCMDVVGGLLGLLEATSFHLADWDVCGSGEEGGEYDEVDDWCIGGFEGGFEGGCGASEPYPLPIQLQAALGLSKGLAEASVAPIQLASEGVTKVGSYKGVDDMNVEEILKEQAAKKPVPSQKPVVKDMTNLWRKSMPMYGEVSKDLTSTQAGQLKHVYQAMASKNLLPYVMDTLSLALDDWTYFSKVVFEKYGKYLGTVPSTGAFLMHWDTAYQIFRDRAAGKPAVLSPLMAQGKVQSIAAVTVICDNKVPEEEKASMADIEASLAFFKKLSEGS